MDFVQCAVASFLVVLAIVRADIGDSCSNTTLCYPSYGTNCAGGSCQCAAQFSEYPERPGWCIRTRRIGSAGYRDECDQRICANKNNQVCNTLVEPPLCACPDTFPIWNFISCDLGPRPNPCIPEKYACTDSLTIQRTCDPEMEPNECDLPVGQNLECDNQTKQCECPDNTKYSERTKACKLKAGEDCYVKDEQGHDLPEHDLCLSQRCGKDQGLDRRCTCPDVNGKKNIWSPDHGCVRDYFDNNCDGDDDCNKFNSSQLVCKKGYCACKKGLTYSQAHCLNATKFYDDPCDREDTCVTEGGTSLTCKNIAPTGNSKFVCKCLPRVEKGAGADRFIPLTWNATAKICDRSPLDSRCSRGYQCKSRNCQNGRCAERGKEGSAGIPVIGYPYKWLVLIGPIIFILNN